MPGLTLELNNEQQFGRALSNLERILTRLDSRLDATGSALTIFERRLQTAGRQTAGVETITRLTTGLSRLDDSLRGISPRLTRFFRDLEDGFRSGRIEQAFTEQGRRLAEEFIQSIERELGISSPSRVMRRIATDIGDGFEQGIDSENFGDEGRRAADEFTDSFEQEARAGLSRLRGIFRNIGADLIGRGQNQIALGQNLLGTGLQQLTAGGLVSFFQGRLVGTVAEFDQTLNSIQVFGRLSEEALANVQRELLDFSAVTVFSARESADAFLGLLKAGLDTTEALAALPEIGNLAAAAQLDLATATNLAIRAASAFRIPFSDINRVIDTFVGGADISTAEVMDLAQALGFVGSSAAALQIPIEDVTAAVAALNDQGIVGERAGTGLRAALDSIVAPTDAAREALRRLGVRVQDEQGNFVGLGNFVNQVREGIQRLREAGAGEAEIVELLSGLGDRNAAAAILALTNTTEDGVLIFDEYREALENANDAQTVATALMDTFKGSITSLLGSVESLLIRAFLPLLNDGIKPIVDFMIVAINRIAELPQPVLTAAAAVSVLVPLLVSLVGALKVIQGISLIASGGFLTQLGTLLGGAGAGAGGIAGAGAAAAGALPALATLLGTLLAIGAAVGIVIVGGAALVRFFRQFVNIIRTDPDAGGAFNAFLYSLQVLFDTVIGTGREVLRILDEFVSSLFRFGDSLGFAFGPDAASITRFFTTLSRLIFTVAGAIDQLRVRLSEVSGAGLNLGTVANGIQRALDGIHNLELPQLQLPNVDLSGIATSIQTGINGLNLESLDFSTLQTNITSSLQNLSFDNVQTIFETHFDTIVNLIVAAASIVFGGPVGIGLGIGKLIVTAIENDFLGIRTFLEQSGIAAAAEDAFNDLLSTVQGIVNSVFGGEGGGITLSPEVQSFLDDVGQGIQTFVDLISDSLTVNVGPGLEDLGEGISGFVESLSGAETEGLVDLALNIARGVGVVLSGIILPLIQGAGVLAGGVLSGIGRALPEIGAALSDFITTLSRIGEGDLGGVAESLLSALGNLFSGLIQFPVGIAEQVINFIRNLSGLPEIDIDDAFQQAAAGLEAAARVIEIIFDRIKRGLEFFFAQVQLEIFKGLEDIRQFVLDASQGQIDIAPQIRVDLTNTEVFITTRTVADEVERLISEQIAEGEIDLTAPINLETPLGDISTTLAEQLASQSIVDQLSATARDRIQEALQLAVEQDPDSETAVALRTAAERLGLDLVEGYATGVEDNTTIAEDASRSLAEDGIIAPLQETLETGSPSQWMFRFGMDVVQGLMDGLTIMLAPLQGHTTAITELFRVMADRANEEVNRVAVAASIAAVRVTLGVALIRAQLDLLIGKFNEVRVAADAAFASINLPGLTVGTDDTPATFGGGRQFGGSVQHGRVYEVIEGDRPEVAVIGGRTYLIPNQNGMVVPTQPLPGGGGSSTVNVGGNTYEINISGAGDPIGVAQEVERAIERRERNNPARRRLEARGVT